jgi:hypothetical protein
MLAVRRYDQFIIPPIPTNRVNCASNHPPSSLPSLATVHTACRLFQLYTNAAMEYQQTQIPTSAHSHFPQAPTAPLKSTEVVQSTTIDVDTAMLDDDRTQRAASVLSGMSAEDMEAAETLNSLHASKRSQLTLGRPQLTF